MATPKHLARGNTTVIKIVEKPPMDAESCPFLLYYFFFCENLTDTLYVHPGKPGKTVFGEKKIVFWCFVPPLAALHDARPLPNAS
jgi:hypothetical protein